MPRHKTITDEELLAVARRVFREHGHTATTREVARQAGISEGVLYQRFGSKEELFFSAMVPREPDFEALLGPYPPTEAGPAFLKRVIVAAATHFAQVIPLALQVIMHPSHMSTHFAQAQPGLLGFHKALTARLQWFEEQGIFKRDTAARTTRLVLSLAHDWALTHAALEPGTDARPDDLKALVDLVLDGIAT